MQIIVEIKSTQKNVSDNYGTAFFVNERGYLITNAHIVTCPKKRRDGQNWFRLIGDNLPEEGMEAGEITLDDVYLYYVDTEQ